MLQPFRPASDGNRSSRATIQVTRIVTQSPRMKVLTDMASQIAPSQAPVLLTGESGTGKEMFARLIHENSKRMNGPFVRVNCAALSENLVESELFGHVRGSFTDAVENRTGRFELASGGTLLLDEISEISPRIQAKLLRVLEEKEFEPVGSCESKNTDARIIATSNRNLNEEVDRGNFRLDLLHRLNVLEMCIPSLRERTEDVALLAMHFLHEFNHENVLDLVGFTKPALQALTNRNWPGNVRELRNVIHRACILSNRETIELEFLKPQSAETSADDQNLPSKLLQTKLVDVEKQIILAAFERYGSKRVVAENLGVSARTLTNKMRVYRATAERSKHSA